jgi:hypothetical protein
VQGETIRTSQVIANVSEHTAYAKLLYPLEEIPPRCFQLANARKMARALWSSIWA